MTLCAAWIRHTPIGDQELIFATDSCLSAGERWEAGVKLFELPRKDCFICFAGETSRAYPMILNLIHAIEASPALKNPKLTYSTSCVMPKGYLPIWFEPSISVT